MRIFLTGNEETCKWHLPVAKSKAASFARRCKAAKLYQNTTAFTFVESGTTVSIQYINGNTTLKLHAPLVVLKKEELKKKQKETFKFLFSIGTEETGYHVLVVDNFGGIVSVEEILTQGEIFNRYTPAAYSEIFTRKYSITVSDDTLGTTGALQENFPKAGTPVNVVDFEDGCTVAATPKCPRELDDPIEQCITDVTDSVVVDAAPSGFPITGIELTQDYFVRSAIRLWCAQRNSSTYTSLYAHKHDWIQVITNSTGWISFGTNIQKSGNTLITYPSSTLFLFYKLFSDQYQCTSVWIDDSVNWSNKLEAFGLTCFQSVNTPIGFAEIFTPTITQNQVKEFMQDTDMAFGRDDLFTLLPNDNAIVNELLSPLTQGKYYSFTLPSKATVNGTVTYLSPLLCPLTRAIITGGSPGYMAKRSNIASHDISLAVQCAFGDVYFYFKSFLEAIFTYNTTQYSRDTPKQVFMGVGNFIGNPSAVINAVINFFTYVRYRNKGTLQLTDVMPNDLTSVAVMTSAEVAQFTDSVFGCVNCYIVGDDTTTGQTDAMIIFDLVNAERALESVPPLTLDFDLQYAAKIHAEDMAANDFIGHYGTDNSSPFDRINATNFGYRIKTNFTIGENCQYASGDTSPEAAITEWMSSTAGHREAILNADFTCTGVATAFSSTGVVYRCQVFGQLN